MHGLLPHGPTLHGLTTTTVLLVTTVGIGEAAFIIHILFTDTILGHILRGITTPGIIIRRFIIPAITVLTMAIPIMDIIMDIIITGMEIIITNLLIQAIMKPIAVKLPMVQEIRIPLILQERVCLPAEALLQDEVAIPTPL